VDLGRVPLELPANVVLLGRWRRPDLLLARAKGWSAEASALQSWLVERIGQARSPVDLASPIELMVTLEPARAGAADDAHAPQLRWVVSLGLSEAGQPPRSGQAGPLDVVSPVGFQCAEARSMGSPGRRLVCASSADALGDLLPFATRSVPLAVLGEPSDAAQGEINLSIAGGPLASLSDGVLGPLLAGWLSDGLGIIATNAALDGQFEAFSLSLANELRLLATDIDGALVRVAPSDEGLELSLNVPSALRGSRLSRVVLGADSAGLAPVEFWSEPVASDAAGFLWSIDPGPLESARAPAARQLATLLEFRGLPQRLQLQANYLLETFPIPRGSIVHASGQLPDPRSGSEAQWPRTLGWAAYDIVGNFAEYRFFIAQLVKAFNDPILGPQFARLSRAALGPRWSFTSMKQRRPKRRRSLPRDSVILEVSVAAERGPASGAPATPFFLLFVPDGDGLQIAWGGDEAFVVSLLSERQNAPRNSETLAGRAALGVLNERRAALGGFYSLAALGSAVSVVQVQWPSLGRLAYSVARAPHRGTYPIAYQLVRQSGASSLSLSAWLQLPVVEDLLFLLGRATE
jgi:hypothetical protein